MGKRGRRKDETSDESDFSDDDDDFVEAPSSRGRADARAKRASARKPGKAQAIVVDNDEDAEDEDAALKRAVELSKMEARQPPVEQTSAVILEDANDDDAVKSGTEDITDVKPPAKENIPKNSRKSVPSDDDESDFEVDDESASEESEAASEEDFQESEDEKPKKGRAKAPAKPKPAPKLKSAPKPAAKKAEPKPKKSAVASLPKLIVTVKPAATKKLAPKKSLSELLGNSGSTTSKPSGPVAPRSKDGVSALLGGQNKVRRIVGLATNRARVAPLHPHLAKNDR